MYKVRRGSNLEKLNERWALGIFVGIRRKSNEVIIPVPEGIHHVRAVKRIPKEKRWTQDSLRWVQWAPWNRYKDCGEADGDVPEGVPAEVVKEDLGKERIVFINTRSSAPRDFYISQEDARRHGYTRGCGGCSSWFRRRGRQPHSEACRERMRGLMRDDI